MTREDITRDWTNSILQDFPTTLVWNGGSYDATKSHLIREKPLVDGGFEEVFALQVCTTIYKIDQNDDMVERFPGGILPDIGQLLSEGNRQYEVRRRIFDPLEAIVQLDCKEHK